MSGRNGPPPTWERVLATLLRPRDREAALGDLAEEHAARTVRQGRRAADRWYRRQALRSLPAALWGRLDAVRPHRDPINGEGRSMWRAIEDRIQDVRWASRMLRRHPAFAVAALLTLGIGIGAATAVFTVVEGVLLRPLPYPEPERLYRLSQDGVEGAYWFSVPNFQDVERGLSSFESVAAWSPEGANAVVDGVPERIDIAEATHDLFVTLGVAPVLGRAFTAEEQAAGAPVVVVSHDVWQRRMGGRPDAIGKTMVLDGEAREVVGVLPPVLMLPADAQVWAPISFTQPEWRGRRGIQWIQVVGRMRAGVDPAAAQAEARALGASLRAAYPDENGRFDLAFRSLQDMTVGYVRTDLGILMAAVVLVLLVAAVNVGGLLLARATARGGEVAVRTALGGGRRRLAWQLVTESAVLGAAGGALGVVLGRLGVAAMLAWAPAGTPRLGEVSMSGPALLFALGAAAASTLLFGVAPALQVLRTPAAGLRAGRRGGRAGARLRDGLVVVQVALALALLVGAGLLGKSLWRLARVDPGFEAGNVLVAGLPVVNAQFASMQERADYLREIQDRAAALPGVTAAGLTNAVPFVNSGPWFSYELPDVETDPDAQLLVRYRVVTPRLFEALGVPIVRGRPLTEDDARPGAELVTVVGEAFVERHFPGGDPIGRLVRTSGETWRIVGVAADVLDGTLRQPSPAPHLYVAFTPATRQEMRLLLRTTGDPNAMVSPLRSLVREISPTQPVTHVRPLEAFLADSVGRPRFLVGLLAFFAGATILLAGVGLYGLLAFNVGRRTREIGVRVALGAPQGKVRTMVVGQGLRLAAAGLVLGLVLALWGGRFLESLLFGVDARDPAILAGAAAGLFLVSAAAAWLPARRATAVSPQEALGVE